jgi:hypothetical protein
MKAEDKKLLFTIGAGVAVYVLIVNPILKKLGLRQSQQITQTQTAGINSPFNPLFWQNKAGALLITENNVKNYAGRIYNSFTLFYDDFNNIMSIFRLLKTQTQVSYLAYKFREIYNADLLTFLSNGGGILPFDGLSDTQLTQIITYVNNLPKSKI